jgi:hypothetical protein
MRGHALTHQTPPMTTPTTTTTSPIQQRAASMDTNADTKEFPDTERLERACRAIGADMIFTPASGFIYINGPPDPAAMMASSVVVIEASGKVRAPSNNQIQQLLDKLRAAYAHA